MLMLHAIVAMASADSTKPTGLLCDFKRSPSLGVRAAPSFSWIVPPCSVGSDHDQVAYQLIVTTHGGKPVWDSGKVSQNDSTYVIYGGPTLNPGAPYLWTVTTWTSNGGTPCQSAPSDPASFITSLFSGWANASNYISVPTNKSTFGYFRKELTVPADVASAQAFIAAPLDNKLLSSYKLYIDGELVNLGPGRAEAAVWGGDGKQDSQPYQTLDVSNYFSSAGTVAVAIEAMKSGGCSVVLQLQFVSASGDTTTIGTDSTWSAFDGDVHRNPGKAQHGGSAGTGFIEYIDARAEPVGWKLVGFKPDSAWAAASATAIGSTVLHPRMEPPMQTTYISTATTSNTPFAPPRGPPGPPGPGPRPPPGPPPPAATCVDVRENSVANIGCPGGATIASITFASFGTPTGSCATRFTANPKCTSNHSLEVISGACVGKSSCLIPATCTEFHEKLSGPDAFCWDVVKSLAVQVKCSSTEPSTSTVARADDANTTVYADFGREFQGGLILTVGDGIAGQTVDIDCGESVTSSGGVGSDWGWHFTWTLRGGAQILEQHKYMECRFVSLTFSGTPPTNMTLTAWKTHYPYYPNDSVFTSSNETLNAVFELCRYTLEAASLDTYTDSNTRERTPYEADGIIAASGRLLIQRDYMWPRHSHAFVINNPTWPVEWKQASAFLGWQDYMATGQPDLAMAFQEDMHDRTMIGFLDSTGLLDTSKMGRHIVDWMPGSGESDSTVALHEFTSSNYESVSNGFGARGLEMLSIMIGKGGNATAAAQYATEAANLKAQMVKQMWNGTNFCDGPCADVGGNSLLMTNMFMLAFGLVPSSNVNDAWQVVANWGMENVGDYGAFWYQLALGSSYYAGFTPYAAPDDGTALYTALTKCDFSSWCSELLWNNETMTRESWHAGTYSHEWGTSAIVGVTIGLMGVHQTSPAFGTFTVMPKLGGLSHGSITVPTLRGFINVTATPESLAVEIPCSSSATLCIPRSTFDKGTIRTPATHALILDGTVVKATVDSGHLCTAAPVGCGVAGAARTLSIGPLRRDQ
eukprot:m.456410 g.456410  ORF g.456410 m.456410 type:complete len:1036 (-) comp21050_c0_seq1:25-3132(-)